MCAQDGGAAGSPAPAKKSKLGEVKNNASPKVTAATAGATTGQPTEKKKKKKAAPAAGAGDGAAATPAAAGGAAQGAGASKTPVTEGGQPVKVRKPKVKGPLLSLEVRAGQP